MNIIEIAAPENAGHDNHTYHGILPEGWAFVPVDPDTLENFPFGTFEVEEIDGKPYMKAETWVPGIRPDPEPIPEPETEPSVWDELDAAYTDGVNAAYDQ